MTDREFLKYLQSLRDKQKETYLSKCPGYEQAKEKGRYLGLERACYQFEREVICREYRERNKK